MGTNKNLYIIAGAIILLLLTFFLGRLTVHPDTKTITVTVPAKSGSSNIVNNPKPEVQIKDSLIYKDSIIYTTGEYNEKLAQDYINLEKRYTDMDLEKERLKKYLESIQVREYQIPFEDDYVKILNKIKAQGEVLSFQQDYTIKERNLEVQVPEKLPRLSVLAGVEVGNTVQLDKFVAKGNIMLQNKKGNILSASYDTEKRVWVGYAFKF